MDLINYNLTDIIEKNNVLLMELKQTSKPITTYELISEFIQFMELGRKSNYEALCITNNNEHNIYNVGGDLELFLKNIKDKNFEDIYAYMLKILSGVKIASEAYLDEKISATIINGECIAGGMTFALSFDIIIAEEGYKIGFPSAKYGIFTGLGTMELLTRKVGASNAAKILTSGKMFTVEEMYDFGMVDFIAKPNEGRSILEEYLNKKTLLENINDIKAKHSKHEEFNINILTNSADECILKMKNLTDKEIQMIEIMLRKQQSMLK